MHSGFVERTRVPRFFIRNLHNYYWYPRYHCVQGCVKLGKKIPLFYRTRPDPDGKISCRGIITHKGHFYFLCSYFTVSMLVLYLYNIYKSIYTRTYCYMLHYMEIITNYSHNCCMRCCVLCHKWNKASKKELCMYVRSTQPR